MVWDFLQIQQDSTLSCSEKLDEIQDLIQNTGHPPSGSLYHVSDVFEDCVQQDHQKCLETAYLISEEVNGFAYTDIGRGLEAIGQTEINAVNQFIQQKIQGQDLRAACNLSKLVPRLYRGQENEMAQKMHDWYDTYSYFFFRAIENTLKSFLEESSGHGATDFSSEIQPIKDKLEDIAQSEVLIPDNAYQDKNYEVVKVAILLNDLEWNTKNTVDWNEIQSNLSQYTHLDTLLNHNNSAKSSLQEHNTHPLTKLLKLDNSDKLDYYDHCLELIQPGRGQNSDPNGDIRDDLLSRVKFDHTIAEVEVANALRREFGINDVTIEETIPNTGTPDTKITVGGETIWVEVTFPRPQASYEVARHYYAPTSPEKSKVRGKVTDKLKSQIRDVKEDTGDLTTLVIKNEESKVDDRMVRDYVEGFNGIGIPEDDDDAAPIILTTDSGLQYDNVPDHLDILVNYDTLNNLIGPPYIEGQVANLTDVDQSIIDQLVDAFNAEELIPR
ncbi:hypothetical protein GOC83_07145 [Haloarcula rubripromontorii]|uniref:Uncharacterized protein n=1 Tax=Haloarcula rubripromontorii TaxID=1705562 RepID=A0A847TS25_9EURY|nr:hypothetical protein [Haloarcula rubripromontorii]NLV05913.1 hypothetical protein [Haloarcula rubripromontorii]